MKHVLILAACLTTFVRCVAQEDVDKLLAESNPVIQKQLHRVSRVLRPVEGMCQSAEACREIKKLKELTEDKVELVKQVAIFSIAPGEEMRPMTAWAILYYLKLPSLPTIRALAPYLDSKNAQLEAFVLDWFHGLDNWGEGGEWAAVNFKEYLDYVRLSLVRGEYIPLPFIRYVFERSPGDALRVFAVAESQSDAPARLNLIRKAIEARQKGTDPPVEEAKRLAGEGQSRMKQRREIELAEHIVENAIWLNKHGFNDRFQQALPEAVEELKKLAGRREWWASLYVARIMQKHFELGRGELWEQLKKDEEELVRDAVTKPSER